LSKNTQAATQFDCDQAEDGKRLAATALLELVQADRWHVSHATVSWADEAQDMELHPPSNHTSPEVSSECKPLQPKTLNFQGCPHLTKDDIVSITWISTASIPTFSIRLAPVASNTTHTFRITTITVRASLAHVLGSSQY
jgi:hypothetical protein